MLIPSIQERKTWLGLLIVLMVGLNLYFNFSFRGPIEERGPWIDQWFGYALSPFQYGVGKTKLRVSEGLSFFSELWAARLENLRLQETLSRQTLELQQLAELEAENERLRELLEFRERQPMDYLVARVVAKDPSVFFRTLTIDRGRRAGIEVNMPVVNAEGVVGRIYEVGLFSSRVLLINDINSRLDTVVQRSRARSIVAGDAEGGLQLQYVPRRQDIQEGDLLVTSGLGGQFPPGFRVGWISLVERDPHVVLDEARVQAAVHFDSVEEVFVIRGRGFDGEEADASALSP